MILMRKSAALLLLPAAMLLGACSNSPAASEHAGASDDEKPNIVVSFYGLEYTTQQIVGDNATVTTLTQPGQEPHDVELKPSQVASVVDADFVIYLKQFQTAVDEAVEQSGNEHVLDAAKYADLLPAHEEDDAHEHGDDDHGHGDGDDDHADEHEEGHHHDHGDFDPHYWQDPSRMAKVGQAIADQLGAQFPDMEKELQANAKSFESEMSKLDGEFADGLANCERKEFITAHTAFNYLADKYHLTQIGISGINPEGEPSPARIAEVQQLAKEHGVTTIFFETLTSPDVSKAIAGDLGINTAVLDPVEGVTDNSPGDDYPSIMRANLEALKEANGCH